MSKSPAYQRYPKDYMSDGNVLRMTFEQRGIYDWLLDSCWLEDGIPADVGELAGLCSLSAKKMAAAWERIGPCFQPHPRKEGWLTNGRLEEEREVQRLWREKSSRGGKRSAEVRKGGADLVEPPLQPKGNTAVRSSQFAIESQKKKPRARATALPEGWTPNDHHREIAKANDVDVADELEGMRDWAKSHGTRRLDWDATFNGWLRRAKQFAPRSIGKPWEDAKAAGELQSQRAFAKTHAGLVPVITERPSRGSNPPPDSGPRLVPRDGLKPAAGLAATIMSGIPRPTENRPA